MKNIIILSIILMVALPLYGCKKQSAEQGHSRPAVKKLSPNNIVPHGPTVYITDYGRNYHRGNCHHLKNRNHTAKKLSEAKRIGKKPCKDCLDKKNHK